MKTDTGCDLKKKLFNQQNTFRPCSGIQTALVTVFAHLCKFWIKNRKRMIDISRHNENKNVNAFSPSLCRGTQQRNVNRGRGFLSRFSSPH